LLGASKPFVQADLFGDLSVFDAEQIFLPGRGRQWHHKEFAECWSGMRPTALSSADHVMAFGDQVCLGCEIAERLPENQS
jgi:hypothetical protein